MHDVHWLLRIALEEFIRKHSHLFVVDANERSMTHKLAEHVQKYFPTYDVDCEYNRQGDVPKQLRIESTPTLMDDTNARTVFPDIIVHGRGNNDNNLLVIEAKKSSNRDGTGFDSKKLDAFQGDPYLYKHGALVLFTVGAVPRYDVEWRCGHNTFRRP